MGLQGISKVDLVFYGVGLVRNVDRPSKFYTYPRFLQLIINARVSDLSSHTTKYTSPALTQKVFTNMRRVRKGFSRVDTPLFTGMLVHSQAQDMEDAAEDEDDINEVSAEPTPPLPTHATPPPPPQQEHIPSPPQAKTAQPSPPPQQQPLYNVELSMTLLNTLLETCATLTKQVANLEQDKIAQAIEIIKLKKKVKHLEKKRQYKSSGLKRLRKVGTTQRVKSLAETGRLEEYQAKVYHLDLEHADKVLSMQETDEAEPTEVEEVIQVVTAAKLITEVVTTTATPITAASVPKASALRKRRGVIIQDPEEAATASVTVHSEVKSKDKGKGILVEEPKPLKRQAQIEHDEASARELEVELNANINWNEAVDQVKRKERQDSTVMRYQALKRKPITEAQAKKNMMVYLKNMAGFKMDFFKGMTYTEIKPIFEKHYNSIQAFLEKGEKEIEEEIVPNDEDDVYTEATSLALKVPIVDYQIHHDNNIHTTRSSEQMELTGYS
uniref:Uncharacterized protein n=1 Tax=Tanacetum cinerariifolium TaxID=118510 RepID=A0A6L2KT03_TANCI|nr:hypothetical protein [Tanacetum cinerariifolium]